MTYEPPGPGRYWGQPLYGPGTAAEIDAGLRQYMVRVYTYMAAGLAISGLVAYLAVWCIPVHGIDRHRNRQPRQYFCRLECAAIRHLCDRRHRVYWAHRLRHSADQAGISGERSRRYDDKKGDSRSFDALSRLHQF